MPKLTIEFDSQEALEGFASWLCESGEQNYWEWYENKKIIVAKQFDYHSENGDFLEGNIIKATDESIG
jgi:hypothetical protein